MWSREGSAELIDTLPQPLGGRVARPAAAQPSFDVGLADAGPSREPTPCGMPVRLRDLDRWRRSVPFREPPGHGGTVDDCEHQAAPYGHPGLRLFHPSQ